MTPSGPFPVEAALTSRPASSLAHIAVGAALVRSLSPNTVFRKVVGGMSSQLLANLLLDDLDTGTPRAPFLSLRRRLQHLCAFHGGGRTSSGVAHPIPRRVLRLRVSCDKSPVAYIEERKFLGYRLLSGGRLGIAPKSLDRAKDRILRSPGETVGQMTSATDLVPDRLGDLFPPCGV
jgi:hypothetical protein